MKLVILRRKLRKVPQHPQEEEQQQTSFKDLLENSRSKTRFSLIPNKSLQMIEETANSNNPDTQK